MKQSFRQSMTWLHTWAGLIFCWVLYFIFATGTLGYFDIEIDQWMTPELPRPEVTYNLTRDISIAESWLSHHASGADRWIINLPNDRKYPYLRVFAEMPESDDRQVKSERISEFLDVHTGRAMLEGRETAGGQTLYRMHYILHYFPRNLAYRFVGILALIMFVGLITGVVIHKKIFKDFFTFRPAKDQRSWLDAHNLLSVVSLPFQLMITYSGLIFVITLWMPLIGLGSYGFDIDKFKNILSAVDGSVNSERVGNTAPLMSVNDMAAVAVERMGEGSVSRVKVAFPGDAGAVVTIFSDQRSVGSFDENISFDGVSGRLLRHTESTLNISTSIADVFLGLHEGLYADTVLRWMYFLSGLLGMAMVATGAIYWCVKRRKRLLVYGKQHAGMRLVSSLNVGTIVGLPIGIAAYFWANRLLPIGLESRADWEVHCLFLTWAATLIYAVFRYDKHTNRRTWCDLLWVAAGLCIFLPVLNAITTDRHLGYSLMQGDWVFAGFDLTALVIGLLCAMAAIKIRDKTARVHVGIIN